MQWLIDIILALIPATPGFVDRGDPGSPDWQSVDLTRDGNYYDLDLSNIVPAGASGVLLRVAFQASLNNRDIRFRKKGVVNWPNTSECHVVVANQGFHEDIIVGVDENRYIQYRVSHASLWTHIQITVGGWFGPE